MSNNVLILMSTYNGEKYLDAQLESLANQKKVKISLLVRDDGSQDNTINILKKWSKRINLKYYSGKNLGSAKSFMNLIKMAKKYSYYAFCDQDDYWDSDKLITAINFLKKTEDKPSLYTSATRIVDEKLRFIVNHEVVSFKNFENAIIKNEAVGCTEVFNYSLMRELKKYEPEFLKMHDSWVCRVCYAIGGKVYVDSVPHISYRQHGDNVVGYKENIFKKLSKQFKTAFKDKIRIRQRIAQELKMGYENEIPVENLKIINNLIDYPHDFKAKIALLTSRHFKTPYIIINVEMKIAILLNKF